MANGPRGMEASIFLMLLALAALGILWVAVKLARRSQRPHVKKPPRKTFEHGRRLAHLKHVATTTAAFAAMKGAPVGDLVSQRGDDRRADVVLRRRKNQPCAQAAGYLAGIFESAWAHEVIVTHPVCAGVRGGECAYTVHRAATRPAARTERASTPGSEDAHRRSPGARAGGG